MTALPSDAEIRARAEQTGLLAPGADLPHDVRRSVAKELLDESRKPAQPDPVEVVLLSRVTHPTADGSIRVDVLFIPNGK